VLKYKYAFHKMLAHEIKIDPHMAPWGWVQGWKNILSFANILW
jgi:hypothetical protein